MPEIYDIIIILELILLEGILSLDNAMALAALVKKRISDPLDQKRALLWGIGGSYVFRTIIIFIGVWIIQNQWIKLLAGLYLIWLFVSELFLKRNNKTCVEKQSKIYLLTPFWSTVISVELMDVMFSIDSIGVALALSRKIWVLVTGAVIGILMMRVAANIFVKLITVFPILIKTAFVLVGIAGTNMVLDIKDMNLPLTNIFITLDCAMSEKTLIFVIVFVIIFSIFIDYFFLRKIKKLL